MVAARLTGCFSREDIREWYRCVTALTLHADSQHLFGNVLFGAPFLILLCRRVGLGLGLFSYLAGRNLRQRPQRMVPPRRAYQPRLLHGPFRHGGRAFRIHGPSRMGQQNAERYRKALLAQRHPPVGRRHGHPRHARHGRRQNGLRRTPVRTALRLHCGRDRKLDITAYSPPLSGHKYATRPERRRVGCVVLEVGAVRKLRSLCRKRAPAGKRAGQSHPLYPKKIRTIQIHYRK